MRHLAPVVFSACLGWTVAGSTADLRHSGYLDMGPPLRAMQDDATANPGQLWLADGESLWGRPDGRAGLSCASCHGDARTSMQGVATRYPDWDSDRRRPVDLSERIAACRQKRQQAPPLPLESHEILSLTVFVASQSKGQPITPPDKKALKPFLARGQELFHMRQGQLDLSCADCHDHFAGEHLGGAIIPEAHPTGYPLYRLEWQSVGSLRRRLRNCLVGMRAEPYSEKSDEAVDLELFLMWRARGMPLETPAIRP
jgi:sulfur-oxidizing protein SoxA